jgi:HPr kinase/phosphorylase
MHSLQNTTIHGVFMSLFGVGTLLIGESGSGKSDLALSLLDRGHVFIADDMVEFSRLNGQLLGRSPKLLKNYLQIRDLGVLDVIALFGKDAVLEKKELSLVIKLVESTPSSKLAFDSTPWALLDITIPSYCLSMSSRRPHEILLETIVRNDQITRKGKDTNMDFTKNHSKILSASA